MATHKANGHPADDELLLAADASGRSDARAHRTQVEWHLEGCAVCRARLDVIEATLAEAAEAYRGLSGCDDALVTSNASQRPQLDAIDATLPEGARACRGRPGYDDAPGTSTRTLTAAPADSMPSMASQRARLAATLAAMPAPRRAWWPPLSAASNAVLPPWALAAAALVVIGLIAPSTKWLTERAGHAAYAGDARASQARELPTAGLTPGAVTQVNVRDLCAGTVPSRVVTAEVRDSVLRAYGMENAPVDTYELDALITPELGGTTDARNLWPQRYTSLMWHARVKDVLEEKLAADVCAGRLDLQTAQRDLATDWVAAYRRYFQSDVPLQAHLAPRAEEPELEIELASARAPSSPTLPLVTLQALFARPNLTSSPSWPSFPSSTRSAAPSRFDPRRTS